MKADENFFPRKFEYPFPVHFRHLRRYLDAIELIGKIGRDERWLDCACGSGYGTRLLADFAEHVVGYDRNDSVIDYARKYYGSPFCSFTADRNSLSPASFSVAFSIETIEHIERWNASEFLKMIRGLLLNDGRLVITTPLVPKSNPQPINPFHLYEYSDNEFCRLLGDAGFSIQEKKSYRVVFTDGEEKEQAYYRCGVR